MQKTFRYIAIQTRSILPLIVLFFAVLAINSINAAWVAPTTASDKENNNVDVPIDTSTRNQTKDGSITAEELVAPNVTTDQFCIGTSCITVWPVNIGSFVFEFFENADSALLSPGTICWYNNNGTWESGTSYCEHNGSSLDFIFEEPSLLSKEMTEEISNKVCQAQGYEFYLWRTSNLTNENNRYLIWNDVVNNGNGGWEKVRADDLPEGGENARRIQDIRCIREA